MLFDEKPGLVDGKPATERVAHLGFEIAQPAATAVGTTVGGAATDGLCLHRRGPGLEVRLAVKIRSLDVRKALRLLRAEQHLCRRAQGLC